MQTVLYVTDLMSPMQKLYLEVYNAVPGPSICTHSQSARKRYTIMCSEITLIECTNPVMR